MICSKILILSYYQKINNHSSFDFQFQMVGKVRFYPTKLKIAEFDIPENDTDLAIRSMHTEKYNKLTIIGIRIRVFILKIKTVTIFHAATTVN